MSPNSRPPLTSRIRASFEGKRSKSEVTSPTNTNGFITQDPEAFRNAIDESINSEAFQISIAANLARIIKPSIKDALDTLQPLVESVYSHEVLLRKTNRSVENILLRLDTQSLRAAGEATPRSPGSPNSPATPRRRGEGDSSGPQDIEQFKQSLEKNNKRTVATLAELASAVDNNNKKVYDLIKGINEIQTTLGPTKKTLDSLKSYHEQSDTTTAVVQAQLDQLKADVGLIIDAVGSDLGKNVNIINEQVAEHPNLFAAHTTRLDAISGDLISLKGQADISEKVQGLSAEIEALKALIETSANSNTENFKGLGTQLELVFTEVESHAGTLSEIKDGSSNPEILAAVQQSNESHASHAVLLSEIKERSLKSGSETAAASVPDRKSESIAEIQALQADLAGLKANLEAGLSSHTENLNGLGSMVDNVLSVVEGHRAADQGADILAAVQKSNDSHASHAEALASVRTAGDDAPPAPAPVSYDTNFTALEEKLASLHAAIESHTGSLDEIKAVNTSTSREIVPVDDNSNSLSDLQNGIATIINKLDDQNEALAEIKDDVSAEILTALHDVGQSQASHSTLLAELREADVSDEILTALHSSNESHASHTAAFAQLQTAVQASNDSHATHSTTLDEIKSSRSLDPEPPAPAPTAAVVVDTAALEANIAALATTLEEHKATLEEIKDVTNASKDSHAAHTASLEEIKSKSVEAAPSGSSNTEALESQIGTLTAAWEEQRAALVEIKDATKSSNESHAAHIVSLGAIQEATVASNASHAAHATTLGELQSTRSLESVPAAETSNGELTTQIGSIISTLKEQNATLATIKETTTNAYVLHNSQAVTLNEVKEATSGLGDFYTANSANLEEIKQSHSALADSYTVHAATLGEIKDATTASNESHATHTATLAELKTVQPRDVPTTKVAAPSSLPEMETHLASILTKLDAQTITLIEIKEASTNPGVLTAVKQNHELLTSSHELLTSHTPLLESLKAGISHADILTNIAELKSVIEDSKTGVDAHGALVKDLHENTKSSHSELTTAIGALALGGAAGVGAAVLVSKDDGDNSSEILSEVKAVRAMVEISSASIDATKHSATSIASQIEINTTTLTTSINALSDELKAEIDATGTQLTESLSVLSGNVQAIDIKSLNGSIDGCTAEVKGLSTSIEALGGQVQATAGKVDGLAEGVHFSDKGVGQLKQHVVTTVPMAEGAWFKKAAPKSSREFEQNEEEPIPEPAPEEVEVAEVPASDPVVEEAVQEPVLGPVDEGPISDPVVEVAAAVPQISEETVIADKESEDVVVNDPVAELVVTEELPTETPVIEEEVSNETVPDKDVDGDIVTKDLPTETPVVEEASSSGPIVDETVVQEIPAKEIITTGPIIEEPTVEKEDAQKVSSEEPTIEQAIAEEDPMEETTVKIPAVETPYPIADVQSAPKKDHEEPETKSVEDLEPAPKDQLDDELEQKTPSHEVKEAEEEVRAEPEIKPSTKPADSVPRDHDDDAPESTPVVEDANVAEEESKNVVTEDPKSESNLPSDETVPNVKIDLEGDTVSATGAKEQQEEKEPLTLEGAKPTEEADVGPIEESEVKPDPSEGEKLEATPQGSIGDEKPTLDADPILMPTEEVKPDLIPHDDDELEKPVTTSIEETKPALTPRVEPELTPAKEEVSDISPTKDDFEETAPLASLADVDAEDEWAMPSKKSKKDKKMNRKSGLSSETMTPSPMRTGENPFDTASSLASPTENSASASTSAFASPSSASSPPPPGGKGKKGKKEKKEPKAKKGKKEKVPFSMDGEEPED